MDIQFPSLCTVISAEQLTLQLSILKVKVKLTLCLTKHHPIKTYWEWRYSSTHSLPRH